MADLAVDIPPVYPPFAFDDGKVLRMCQEQGISYSALGAQLGRNYATVSNWLRGLSDPPASMVGALAHILNVHPGDLYRPASADDVAIDVRPMIQVRTVSRRKRQLTRK